MREVHVHALIDSLGGGGAEMLLPELAAVASGVGLRLTVGYMHARQGAPAASRLRALGVEPELLDVHSLGVASARAVRDQVRRLAPDVVHTHLDASDILGGVAAATLRIPAVATLHAMRWAAPRGLPWARMRIAAAVRRRCASRVVAVSEAAAERYLATGWLPPRKLVVVPNGIAGTPRPGAGAAVRAALGLGSGEFVVALVAALRPEKNHALAAAAVGLLARSEPGARLLVVGDGPHRREVERAVAALDGRGIMAGHRDDVMAVLDAADAMLHVPRFDALPTAVMDAMAAGVPVVGARVGGLPELIGDGAGVLLGVEPSAEEVASALGALARDPGRRAALARAARARFEQRFTAAAWAQRLRALYDEVLAERGR
jgi:glycosyltransferase involved in cell wall biosynthesis